MVKFTYKNPKYLITGTQNKEHAFLLEPKSWLFRYPLLNLFKDKFPIRCTKVEQCALDNPNYIKYSVNLERLFEIINIGKTRDFVELIIEIDNIPVICKSKKLFSKYNTVKLAEPNGLVNSMRIVTTPDNGNRVFELILDQSSLPKKIRCKALKLSDNFAAEIEIKTVNKPVEYEKYIDTNEKENAIQTTQQQSTKIIKRKFEIPYPVKLAAGIVAFFGVLEVGSALISKVVNKIK